MPTVLTDLEERILDFMVQYLRTNTYQPSIREIGEAFDIKSTKTVSEYLGALADKGYLERDPSRSRGVRILGVDLSPQTVSVPCFVAFPDDRRGFVTDGVDTYYSVDRRMAGARGCYFVRARADELAALGMAKGDLILVEPASTGSVPQGGLVVVQTPEGSDLFRYGRNGDRHLLEPIRAGGAGMRSESGEVPDIRGRVIAIHRRFDDAVVPVRATAH